MHIYMNVFGCLVGCVLWYISPFRLFNAKSCLNICITCILFVNE